MTFPGTAKSLPPMCINGFAFSTSRFPSFINPSSTSAPKTSPMTKTWSPTSFSSHNLHSNQPMQPSIFTGLTILDFRSFNPDSVISLVPRGNDFEHFHNLSSNFLGGMLTTNSFVSLMLSRVCLPGANAAATSGGLVETGITKENGAAFALPSRSMVEISTAGLGAKIL